MKIPEYLKREVCDICGEHCVRMADGRNYYDESEDRVFNLIVCYECYLKFGDIAYQKVVDKKMLEEKITAPKQV